MLREVASQAKVSKYLMLGSCILFPYRLRLGPLCSRLRIIWMMVLLLNLMLLLIQMKGLLFLILPELDPKYISNYL